MAVISGTTQTYQQGAKRESLADRIYDISPEETPFLSNVKKGPKAKAVFEEWPQDNLAAATARNAVLEGDDATYRTATTVVRVGNYTQILDKAIIVSDTANAILTAGRKSEIAYQASKRMRELKRDLEKSLTGNNASQDGSAATARLLGSLESWYETNTSRGSNGADGGYSSTTKQTVAATDASSTNLRAFSETLLKAEWREIVENGIGRPTICMVGTFNKQRASTFPGIAELRRDTGMKKPDKVAILGAADIYVGDFGQLTMVWNLFSRARTAHLLDMDYWEIRYLQNWSTKPLARTGHAEKKLISCEVTLCALHEGASGVIADLTTS